VRQWLRGEEAATPESVASSPDGGSVLVSEASLFDPDAAKRAEAWLRRLYTSPDGSALVAMDRRMSTTQFRLHEEARPQLQAVKGCAKRVTTLAPPSGGRPFCIQAEWWKRSRRPGITTEVIHHRPSAIYHRISGARPAKVPRADTLSA
jgi:hypothetical protein